MAQRVHGRISPPGPMGGPLRKLGAAALATLLSIGMALWQALRFIGIFLWYLLTGICLGVAHGYRQMSVRAGDARLRVAVRLYRLYAPVLALIDDAHERALIATAQGIVAALCVFALLSILTAGMKLLAEYSTAAQDLMDTFFYTVFPIH